MQAVIRAVCTLIDAFHFDIAPSYATAPAEPQAVTSDTANEKVGPLLEGPAEQMSTENVAGPAKDADANSGREILGTLTRRVLPVLQSVLVLLLQHC